MAVGRLQGGAEAIAVAIKGHVELQQPLDAGRGLAHQQGHGGWIAEAGAGLEGVFDVALEAVLGAGHGGDAALGPAAGRAGSPFLAEQQDAQARGQFQAGHQAGRPASHHNHIPAGFQGCLNRTLSHQVPGTNKKSRREGPTACTI